MSAERLVGAFIALKIPSIQTIQTAAAARMIEFGLQDTAPVHREGEPHITLRYLGDTTTQQVHEILATWNKRHGENSSPFMLHLDNIDAFPTMDEPTFIWAAPGGNTAALRTIQSEIDRIVTELGIGEADFPFTPHITIARVDYQTLTEEQQQKVRNVALALRRDPPFHPTHLNWQVTTIKAMAHNRGRSDARYRAIAEVHLGGNKDPQR